MGDRGNIVVLQDESREDQVWLYSHWGGEGLWEVLQRGLAAHPNRLDDPSYLARIIFSHMVPADLWREETGFGISTRITDNEYPILAVDVVGRRVFVIPESGLKDGRIPEDYTPTTVWTFEEYIKLRKDPREKG